MTKDRLIKLREELHKYNHAYYVLNKPSISDYDFDMLLKELETLETKYPELDDPNSPTKRVGSDLSNDFAKINHKYPMLSLGNTYSIDELKKFVNDALALAPNAKFTCELKFDGASGGLIFSKGKFQYAVTRGDGVQGDDITNNVKTMKAIPLVLDGGYPDDIEIRGEFIVPKKEFERLNKIKLANGDKPYANPRNLTSGSIKLKRPKDAAKRKILFFPFQVLGDGWDNSHYANLSKVGDDFNVSDFRLAPTNKVQAIVDFINDIEVKRSSMPFEIDGIVIKVDNSEYYETIGWTSKQPKWATAYKYKAARTLTQLKSIGYQTGKTGQITPVANLVPVLLAGTTVKRASLHNEDIMKELDLHYHDFVYIEKGGEIIPKIVDIEQSKRLIGAKPVEFILACPDCGTPIHRAQGEANHFCPNERFCPSQVKGKLEYFASKKAMNIEIGPSTINKLYEACLITRVEDYYELTKQDLVGAKLDGFADKKINNLLKSINDSKKQPYHKVLTALGIDGVGSTVSKVLAKEFPKIKDLEQASHATLIKVDDIGDTIASNIINFFKRPTDTTKANPNRLTVIKLFKAGLKFEIEQTGDKLKGKRFAITGSLSKPRDYFENLISQNGGEFGGLSKKTDYLLTGSLAKKSSKMIKAEKDGTTLLDENTFLKLI